MKKVVCIIQARMGSSRLPGKVMMNILGEPMISYTLRRLSKCTTIDQIVLATSDLDVDTPLSDYVTSIGYECYRGSEDDVLERYVFANRKYGGDIVIRVTGDCPVIDPQIVDLAVNTFLNDNADYISLDDNISTIRGLNIEVFSKEALEKTYNIVSALSDYKNYKEHVTIYMYRHPDEFVIKSAKPLEDLKRPYRLCVDEPDDFKLIETIYNHFGHHLPTAKDIIDFLDKNPVIASINKDVQQKNA